MCGRRPVPEPFWSARIIIPKTILKKIKFSCFKKFCLEIFCIFAPPPPPAVPKIRLVSAQSCASMDGFPLRAAESFPRDCSFGPMSSFPVMYSNKFGVHALHPTRYRPPAMSTGHPEKRTTMWAALWEKRPMVATSARNVGSSGGAKTMSHGLPSKDGGCWDLL